LELLLDQAIMIFPRVFTYLKINYFIVFILLFIIEVVLAVFVHDDFIRPFLGDYIVVLLMYCFIMAFTNFSFDKVAFFVLFVAFMIEFMQYFKFIERVGLQDNHLLKISIGATFSIEDLSIYVLAFFSILVFEKKRQEENT